MGRRKSGRQGTLWVQANGLARSPGTKMKDGRTHLAHKAEHAVDMESGAVVAVRVESAIAGDSQTVEGLLEEVVENLQTVIEDPEAEEQLSESLMSELVADRGYHCNDVLEGLEKKGVRTYISEPARGKRNWKGKPGAQTATYNNRRRIKRAKGQRLQRRRGELIERGFAHNYETGGLRRVHLRGRSNILKRVLIHVAGFNLSLVMRKLCGVGIPRTLQGRLDRVLLSLMPFLRHLQPLLSPQQRPYFVPTTLLRGVTIRPASAMAFVLPSSEPVFTTGS